VARAGQVGIIALRSWEKFRGGMRLEFVCGGRALREFGILRDSMAGSLRFLSVAPQDLPSAIEGAQAENKDLRRAIRDLGERLAVHEAAAMVARARQVSAARVIVEVLDGWDQSGLKALASAASAQPGVVAALVSAAGPALVVIARAPDVALDASAALKALMQQFGGKGGGKPEMAQGGGLSGTRDELREALARIIDATLRPAP
jgi:alanyl-tRNA synthetase